ncbi:hypothetical protein ACLMJK_001301 [Lecanora helva]
MDSSKPLRIGFVPEHFSTPLHFARSHYGLSSTLIPFPSGTGHMISSIQSNEIDIGIGLTEGWVAGLGKAAVEGKDAGYRMVGTYVETPLCWAISTGAKRENITEVQSLKGKKLGVSRIGSGSYVMGYVLADSYGWLSPSTTAASEAPFDIKPLQTFAALRAAVNDNTADFFMWEHFTSKRYYDNGEIKRIGEIYTPWPSWHIVASNEVLQQRQKQLEELFTKLDAGVKYFNEHQEEAVGYISTELDYSAEDAREWLKTVKFADGVKGVSTGVVEETVKVLRKAGVLGEVEVEAMIGIGRKE